MFEEKVNSKPPSTQTVDVTTHLWCVVELKTITTEAELAICDGHGHKIIKRELTK